MKNLLITVTLLISIMSLGQELISKSKISNHIYSNKKVNDQFIETTEWGFGYEATYLSTTSITPGVYSSSTFSENIIEDRVATLTYDKNPFNDNLKQLTFWRIHITISISDVLPEKIEFLGLVKGISSIEYIFDDDKSTYFKVDLNNVNSINTLDHELIIKIKKHSNVVAKYTYSKKKNKPLFKEYSLKGSLKAFNEFTKKTEITKKNKNSYEVFNGLANVNPFNLDKYIDKFILDAKTNHNIDLSYVNKKDKLILFKELDRKKIAIAYKMNDDDSVLVLVDPENWYKANQPKRWYIIYHELGHDILNLEHGECGPLMNETTSGNYSWDRLEKDKNIMFEKYKSKT